MNRSPLTVFGFILLLCSDFMKANVDYGLLVNAEKIRYQSDFSSAHWLHQVISQYEHGIEAPRVREAYESVLRTAINCGCKAAVKLATTFPDFLGFPNFKRLSSGGWKATQKAIMADFDRHETERFRYVRDGD